MNCWQCKHELVWNGDHTGDEVGNEEYEMFSSLSCPNCDALVEVYWSKKKDSNGKVLPIEWEGSTH